ncbi:MAG: VCBS repeat-containing protein [Pyrinomonadaceae bacterium]|nr:VCBS repeat-containing protein [Pyrinomonadaceae bacterium]
MSLTAQIPSKTRSDAALRQNLASSFSRYDLINLNTQNVLAQVKTNSKFTLTTNEREFELHLQPRDFLAANYKSLETTSDGTLRALARPATQTFKGTVANAEESSVRLTITNDKISGFIAIGDTKFYIEPAKRYSKSANADEFIVYNADDALTETPLMCAAPEHKNVDNIHDTDGVRSVKDVTENANAPNAANAANALPTVRVIEIATEADFQFVTASGSARNANAEILETLNVIEGVYEQQLGLSFSVTFQHVWTTPDPYSSNNSNDALRNFQSYWNANFPMSSFPRDTAHIFTGKPSLAGQGLAFVGTICNLPDSTFGDSNYGLSGRVEVEPAKFVLTAHEIAHNVNATHVNAAQSCDSTIMNATITQNTPLVFCQFSRNEVTNYINVRNGCLTSRVLTKTRFDFDGDDKSDLSVFRGSDGNWYIQKSGLNEFAVTSFGVNRDKPVPEDYDGDGLTDIAVYRNGSWFILSSRDSSFRAFNFGTATDIPAPADFTGDGKSEIAVFRPSDGNWYRFDLTNNSFTVFGFGMNNDVPVAADYDGDGRADIAVFRPSAGTWYVMRSTNNSFFATGFGISEDRPVPADYDGDGRADIAVFRPSAGLWYVLRSTDNSFFATGFGVSTDAPIPASFVR